MSRDIFAEISNTRCLVGESTQLLFKNYLVQFYRETFQGQAAVTLPEKRCITQARSYDPFISLLDQLRGDAVDIGYGDKIGSQFACVRVRYGKILLVRLHGGNERFRGEFKELFIKRSGDRHRPFHQRRHFIQEILIHQHGSPEGLRSVGCRLPDLFFPLTEIGRNVSLILQPGQVFPGRGQGNRLRMMETMPAGVPARFRTQYCRADNVLSKQQYRPMHGPHKLYVAVAPAHAP